MIGPGMTRICVTLPKQELALLTEICRFENLTISQALNQGMTLFLRKHFSTETNLERIMRAQMSAINDSNLCRYTTAEQRAKARRQNSNGEG